MRYLLLLLYLFVFFVICEYIEDKLPFAIRLIDVLNILIVLVFMYFSKEKVQDWKKGQPIVHYIFVIVFGLSFSFLNGIIYLDREWMMDGVEVYNGFSAFTLLRIVVLSPILEELLYRKYWYTFLGQEGRYKIWNIILISFVFSLTHWYSETPLIWPFIASLFLFWIYSRTKNILLCIVCHVFVNIGLFIIPSLLTPKFERITEIVTVLIFLCSVLLFNKILKKKEVTLR
ncbi:CPBP family intramembrane metalloprotease [Myroides sp. 1354]|uniref:CPBP family intramembrane glutamic endopeptidase n=1 Tax=unclassified Myroides TaxID=2642485 RepID=UPI00257749ED|nr:MULTISPECIES: CPBP family intramembrane glutamic endopeptidase [unclassified Myroides]MDM1045398.1 CPBP family intramembrane metalloprotease [Myroides sp. R163-1]MDM1056365.1 CPBP family intramembrane metalloprotease [Myroides sp. 1354]MDM1069529.1 CPBP family intramembrane metalloprotease [Myroides sp. 1372]